MFLSFWLRSAFAFVITNAKFIFDWNELRGDFLAYISLKLCVVLLDRGLYSHSLSRYPEVKIGAKKTVGKWLAIHIRPIPAYLRKRPVAMDTVVCSSCVDNLDAS